MLVAKPGAGIFAGTPDGVYHSSDEGEHWSASNNGLAVKEVYSLCFGSDGYLYAGTSGAGVYRLPLEVTAVRDNHRAQLPTMFALEQNYPNPFNPTTGIRFQVSNVGEVKITVYDLLGREVAILVDEIKQPGVYQVDFDGSGLASGVYICRMSAGSYVQSRTMLLIK